MGTGSGTLFADNDRQQVPMQSLVLSCQACKPDSKLLKKCRTNKIWKHMLKLSC